MTTRDVHEETVRAELVEAPRPAFTRKPLMTARDVQKETARTELVEAPRPARRKKPLGLSLSKPPCERLLAAGHKVFLREHHG